MRRGERRVRERGRAMRGMVEKVEMRVEGGLALAVKWSGLLCISTELPALEYFPRSRSSSMTSAQRVIYSERSSSPSLFLRAMDPFSGYRLADLAGCDTTFHAL